MNNKKILIIEDEQDIGRLLKRIIEREKFTVFHAETGKAGLDLLYSEDPDLVVLDINLPDTTGWEICKEIRKDPLYRKKPIIMLTIRSTTNDRIKGLDLGADDYMPKPFIAKELILRIKKLLAVTEK